MSNKTVFEPAPTRKQRFEAALKLAGITAEQWRRDHYQVSAQHLNEVWKNDLDPNDGRVASAELNAAINGLIRKHLGSKTVGANNV